MLYRRNFGYLLSLVPAAAAIWGNLNGGWWSVTNLVFSFGFLGIAEIILPADKSNKHSNPKDPFPEFVLFIHVLSHTAVLCSLFYGIHTGILQNGFIIWAALSSGAEAGSGGIIVAHELVHKANPLKQFLGKYLLATSGNIYFFVHHLRIHHRFVGTGQDAATARFGESVYQFQIRTMIGQTREAWQSEKQRLQKIGKPAFSLSNMILQNILLQFIILGFIGFFFSLAGLGAWLICIFTAHLLLEYVNYIEHYGLVRDDRERVNEMHSWNCDKVISRFFLVELSRHADHHFFASKPFHTLDTYEHSPMLPGGYASMVFPALVPPLWRAIVHPRLREFQNKTVQN